MLKRLARSKRALSPVVTTVFLFGIMVAGIGISLGIIFPSVQQLNEQIDLEIASVSLINLDEDLQALMLSGAEGRITKQLNLGESGVLIADNISTSIIILGTINSLNSFTVLSSASPSLINLTQSRLIIRQSIQQSAFPTNTNSYLSGQTSQDFFYLNATNQGNVPWEILNQSRFNDNHLYTTLSYRNIVTSHITVDPNTLTVNLTLSIFTVQFNFIDRSQSISNNPFVHFEYKGLSVTTYDWNKFTYNPSDEISFGIKTVTSLWDINSIPFPSTSTESPFSMEVPTLGILNVRIQILTQIIDIDI